MMDLSATFTASSSWDTGKWNNPRLDSSSSVYSAKGQDYTPQWWAVDLPGDDFYETSELTLMKRGDGGSPERTINAVKL